MNGGDIEQRFVESFIDRFHAIEKSLDALTVGLTAKDDKGRVLATLYDAGFDKCVDIEVDDDGVWVTGFKHELMMTCSEAEAAEGDARPARASETPPTPLRVLHAPCHDRAWKPPEGAAVWNVWDCKAVIARGCIAFGGKKFFTARVRYLQNGEPMQHRVEMCNDASMIWNEYV